MQAQNAARETQQLFEAGRIGYLPVLDALRTIAQIEQSVAAAQSRVATDQLDLFLALGGGWGDGAGYRVEGRSITQAWGRSTRERCAAPGERAALLRSSEKPVAPNEVFLPQGRA